MTHIQLIPYSLNGILGKTPSKKILGMELWNTGNHTLK